MSSLLVLGFAAGGVLWAYGFPVGRRLVAGSVVCAIVLPVMEHEGARALAFLQPFVGPAVAVALTLLVLWVGLAALTHRAGRSARPAHRRPERPTQRRRAEVEDAEPEPYREELPTRGDESIDDDLGLWR